MNTATFVFGVDLDGVVANFIEGLRPVAAEWLGGDESALPRNVGYGFAEWHLERMGKDAADGYERLHRFAVTQRNLFRDLPPIEGAPAALRRISALGVRIRIITHRLYIKHFHRAALAQTIDWLAAVRSLEKGPVPRLVRSVASREGARRGKRKAS